MMLLSMRALVSTKPGSVEFAELPDPVPGPEEVVVAPRTLGICGTDVKVLKGAIPARRPLVVGHEAVGVVVESGPETTLPPGTRVLIDPASSCGRCDLCRRGKPHLCRNAGLMGREIDGVWAERVVVPEHRLVVIPDDVSPVAAGVLQVLGTVVHAQRQVDVFPGQTAVVIGLGVSGQLMVQLLALRGVRVLGITRSAWKRELAERLGAEATSSPDRAADLVADATSGRGPELVVEAAGTEQTLAQAIDLAGVGGQVLVFGTLGSGGEGLPYYQLYFKELTVHNPRAALIHDYESGVSLAGRLQLEPIVTHRIPFDRAPEAFDLVEEPSSLKVLLEVT
jgi:2-desacetyl-2-hydroxyethyl bacteriochlorophyllide A dehydrogenase